MTKKYEKYRMYREEGDVYKEEKKQIVYADFVKKVGDTFLKALPSLLCVAVKTLISKILPKRRVFI